jgi:hypothetical protein
MQRCGLFEVEKDQQFVCYMISEPDRANVMACLEARSGGPKAARTGVSA